MSPPIQVAIVEDDAGLRHELERLINETEGFACQSTYPDAEAARVRMRSNTPALDPQAGRGRAFMKDTTI